MLELCIEANDTEFPVVSKIEVFTTEKQLSGLITKLCIENFCSDASVTS